jgi:hypothetical protein
MRGQLTSILRKLSGTVPGAREKYPAVAGGSRADRLQWNHATVATYH